VNQRKLRLAISSGTFYPDKARVERAFAFAESSSLDGLEVICDTQEETYDADKLQALIDRHSLPILSLHAPFPGQAPPIWGESAMEILSSTARLAARVGAEHVVVHLPHRLYLRPILGLPVLRPSRFGKELRRIMEEGRLSELEDEFEVRLCVENLPHQHRLIPDRLLFLWNTVDEWVSCHRHLTLDTTHWGTKSISPVQALQAAGEAVRHIHLSNYAAGTEHLPPQFGELDLGMLLRKLASSPGERIVVIELAQDRMPQRTDEQHVTLRQAVSFCRGHIDPVSTVGDAASAVTGG
jgi:sugar phosphate isomerase/epimerase